MIKKLLNMLTPKKSQNKQIEKGVEYSLKKYKKTYKLLEQYDKKFVQKPETMADPGRLRGSIRELQREAKLGRANSTI